MSVSEKSHGLAGDKIVLVKLKPEMTREQQKRNLLAALEKSGVKVKPVSQQREDTI